MRILYQLTSPMDRTLGPAEVERRRSVLQASAASGIEVLVAYQHFSMGGTLTILLGLAVVSGALAVMYFMHLAQERRSLVLTLIPALIFVLLMMNVIWSDGFRLHDMRPFPH